MYYYILRFVFQKMQTRFQLRGSRDGAMASDVAKPPTLADPVIHTGEQAAASVGTARYIYGIKY